MLYGSWIPRVLGVALVSVLLAVASAAPASASIVHLDVQAVQIAPLEGVPFTVTVGSFPDPNAGPYIADITWGDGETSQGSFSQGCQGDTCTVLVAGHHVYRKVGTYAMEVHVFNFNSSADGRDSKSITVKDAPLSSPTGRTVGMVPNQEFTTIVGQFGDADLFADPVNYTITVDWGDGTMSPGIAAPDARCCGVSGVVGFSITGTHTYTTAGHYSVTSTVTDLKADPQKPNSVTVHSVIYSPIITMVPQGAVEGAFFQGIVASIPMESTLVSYQRKIDWGDGTVEGPSPVTQGCGADGCHWFASGGHTYREEATYDVVVTFLGSDGSGGTGGRGLVVADAPLKSVAANTVPMVPGQLFDGIVATFLDPSPFATVSDFTAEIDWGDGETSSGVVQARSICCSGTGFQVLGTHAYVTPGPFTVHTLITDKGGSQGQASGTAGGIAVTMGTITLTAGKNQPNGFLVATFRTEIPCSDFAAPSYSATIDWGDGTQSHGGISNGGGCAGTWFLGDRHIYGQGGFYTVSVTVRGSDGTGGSGLTTATVNPVNGPPSNPSPLIGTLTPSTAAQGGSGLTLNVSGSNFNGTSVVRFNGIDLPSAVLSTTLISATVPASDLTAAGDLNTATVTVFTPAPGGGTSNPLPFTVMSGRVARAESSIAPGGGSASTSTAPTSGADAGVNVSFANTGADPVTLTAATYNTNPTGGTVLDVGGGFVDVRLAGAPLSGSAVARFYYPTGAVESGLQLQYFTGSGWARVLSSGGAVPVIETADNLDGTVSGGRFVVTFDDTSTPALSGLGGTVFTMAGSAQGTATPTPTATARATATATITPTATATATVTPTATPIPSDGGGDGGGSGGPSPSDTPELDSLLLFGSGLAGLAAAARNRWRRLRR